MKANEKWDLVQKLIDEEDDKADKEMLKYYQSRLAVPCLREAIAESFKPILEPIYDKLELCLNG